MKPEEHSRQVSRKELMHKIYERVIVMRRERERRIKLVVPVVVIPGEDILRVKNIAVYNVSEDLETGC